MQKLWVGRDRCKFLISFLLTMAVVTLAGCGAGGAGTSAASGVGSTTTPSAVVAALALSASPQTVNADGSSTTTISVTALNAANAAIPSVLITLSADTGFLGSPSVTTGATGAAATVTFSAGSNRVNRIATITATSGSVSAQIPLQIIGSTVSVSSTGTTLPDNGTLPATLTIRALDAGGIIVANAAVNLTQAGAGTVQFYIPASGVGAAASSLTGVTNSSGIFTADVAGSLSGAVSVKTTALGATVATAFTVSPSASTFAIDQLTLNAGTPIAGNPGVTAMKMGDALAVEVNAPNSTSVEFVTTIGLWNGTSQTVQVPVSNGKATATLTTALPGVASIEVYDPNATSTTASLTVGMTSSIPAKITIQPSPAVISKSGGSITTSTLTATVKDAVGNPVGGTPIAFSIVNPTGGGETVTPIAFSAATPTNGLSLGQATSTFTSGSLPTGAAGVQIRASVVGTAIATNTAPSGSDATIVIGGTAGSVTFGQATVIGMDASQANYVLPMSILVADSNGNPAPVGTVVNLSVWPIAWSTGTNCTPDLDTATSGTFYNEDINENLTLDPGEDGYRKYYPVSSVLLNGVIANTTVAGGTVTGSLIPPNSSGGTLPAQVTTDQNGAASFNLTYTKRSAIWIISRLRARTVVQGTSAVGEIDFRLVPSNADVTTTTCLLPPDSPYNF